MTKTVRQRLQSRISLRRNAISEDEAMIAHWKTMLKHTEKDSYIGHSLISAIRNTRQEIKGMAEDQRLDRQLYAMVLYQESMERFDTLLMNSVTDSVFVGEEHF